MPLLLIVYRTERHAILLITLFTEILDHLDNYSERHDPFVIMPQNCFFNIGILPGLVYLDTILSPSSLRFTNTHCNHGGIQFPAGCSFICKKGSSGLFLNTENPLLNMYRVVLLR